MKVFVASFHRASDGALSKLVHKLNFEEDMLTLSPDDADVILACGDRVETFDFVLEQFRKNKRIVHLWAGEVSQGTHDEVYRHSMTLMSEIQLCTNKQAKKVVEDLCKAVGKKSNAFVVGNVMLDNLEIDESNLPTYAFDLVLYNPPTNLSKLEIEREVVEILSMTKEVDRLWIESNGDVEIDLLKMCSNTKTLPREKFLGLLKNCRRFITNSSCAYYEAPFMLKKEQIIIIGERNKDRNSVEGMDIKNASDNIIKVLKGLR